MKVADNKNTLEFVNKLIDLMKNEKNKLYLHCKGGHGRTGVIVSLLISLKLQLSQDESLSYCQALHTRRYKNYQQVRKILSSIND